MPTIMAAEGCDNSRIEAVLYESLVKSLKIVNLLNIRAVINSISSETVVIFSNLTLRTDSDSLAEEAKRVKSKLEEVCKRDNIFIVDN